MRILSLPFTLDRDEMRGHDAAHGVDGIVALEAESIRVSYTLRMATVGGAQVMPDAPYERLSESLDVDVATHTDTVSVAFADIRDVTMSGGVLRSPRLILRVHEAATLLELPWSDGLSCMMRMRRADGQALRVWITEAELRLARAQLGGHVGR